MYEGCQVYEELIEQRAAGRQCEITGDGSLYTGHNFNITQEADVSAAGFQWRVVEEGGAARRAKKKQGEERKLAAQARNYLGQILGKIAEDVCEHDTPEVPNFADPHA